MKEYRCKCGSLEFNYLGRQFNKKAYSLGQEIPTFELVNCIACGTTIKIGKEYIERAGINQVKEFKK